MSDATETYFKSFTFIGYGTQCSLLYRGTPVVSLLLKCLLDVNFEGSDRTSCLLPHSDAMTLLT